MTVPKIVLLDADGVVQAPAPTWRPALEALCGEPERSDEFLADVFAAERPCLAGYCTFEVALAEVLAKWGSDAPLTDAISIWTQIEPDPDILNVATSLRSTGVVVALATNQQAYRAAFMSQQLGYRSLFDHLLFSCDLGHVKPSPEYFSAALAYAHFEPNEALFIDDHKANVEAARAYGLSAEEFHMSEGVDRFKGILYRYGLRFV